MNKTLLKGITLTIFVGLLTIIVLQQGNYFNEEIVDVNHFEPPVEKQNVVAPEIDDEQPKSYASIDSTFTHVIAPVEKSNNHLMYSSKVAIFSFKDEIKYVIPLLTPQKLTTEEENKRH